MLIEHRDGFIPTFDGLKLYEQSWIPEGERRGLLLFVHGYGEHCDRYRYIAEHFVSQRWVIFTYDHRGHGRSGGIRAHISDFNHYLEDLALMLRRANDINRGEPIFLVGHSMGGLVAALFAAFRQTEQLKGLVLSSPMFKLAVEVPKWKEKLGKFMSNLYPSLALDNGIDPRWLSHDETVVMRYERDPLVNTVATARWFTSAIKAMQKIRTGARNIKLPTLIMQGGADKLVDPSGAKEVFEMIGAPDKKLRILDNYYHEIFNEVGRLQIYEELETWLEEHNR
ncbi:MAG: alpha/beta hydrolase [Myxococcota bacterium]